MPEVLQLRSYPALVALLQPRTRKQVAERLVQALLDKGNTLGEVEAVQALFDFIAPLVEQGDEGDMDDEVRRLGAGGWGLAAAACSCCCLLVAMCPILSATLCYALAP